jgi:hypothetical protein
MILHQHDYGTFLPARDFSYSIWNSDALLARIDEAIE